MIPLPEEHFVVLAAIADSEAGLHMPAAKQNFVASRLQRRLRRHGLGDFGTYLRLVSDTGPNGVAERRHMVSALTTNVTDLFREPHHFALLAAHLPAWSRSARLRGSQALIWSAGCASGEEPLSIAATCRAVLGSDWQASIRILATDVDQDVLDIALDRTGDPEFARRIARLPPGIGSPRVPWPRGPDEMVDELQRGITYLRHNLRDPLPLPGQFEMIFCRNVTIYFSPQVQRDVHRRLRARLAQDGLLAIGHSERISCDVPGLSPIGRTAFRRAPNAAPPSAGAARCC